MIKETTKAKVEFHERYWANVSNPGPSRPSSLPNLALKADGWVMMVAAKDFIKSLIKADPSARPTATEALNHPWLTQHQPSKEHDLSGGLRDNWSASSPLSSLADQKLKVTGAVRGARRRWRTTIKTVQASNRLKSFTSSRSTTPASSSQDADSDSDADTYHDTKDDDEEDEERVLGGGPEAQVVENEKADERKRERENSKEKKQDSDKKLNDLVNKVSAVEV